MDRNTELLRAAEWNAPEPPEEKEPIEPETVDEIEDNRFTVTTASEADWTLMKLGEIERLEAQNKELANNNINRIRDWLDKQNAKTNDSKNYFKQLLTDYIFEEKTKNPKFKLVTPNGKLSTRKLQPKWEYNDDDLIKSLKDNDETDFIKLKESVNKASLKKVAKVKDGKVYSPNGVALEGVTVIPASETAVIKTLEVE